MNKIFLMVLNMSITAGYAIIAVLLVRLFLKKAPKVFSYALWLVVLFRLVCPFSFESAVSLLPVHSQTLPQNIGYQQNSSINSGISSINNAVNHLLPAAPQQSMNSIQEWLFYGCLIWITGILILLTYGIISAFRLKRQLSDAKKLADNIFLADNLKTPFVLGFFKPHIYLPASLNEEEMTYILHHEQTHIRRQDHVVKLLAFFVLCLHWFNPLVWIAFVIMTKDMEMSCDETVLREMGCHIKKSYSSSLLTLASGYPVISGTPLCFGEGDVKGRIKNVLSYKKPAFWVLLLAMASVAAVAFGLISNPQNDRINITDLLTGKKSNESSEAPKWLSEAYQWRTKYVGNASAVGNITDCLYAMADTQKNGFELDTTAPPYGVTVNYISPLKPTELYADYATTLQQDSAVLFALIENLDTITIKVNNEAIASYSRSTLEETFGSLWTQSKSYEGLCSLYEEVYSSPMTPASPDSFHNDLQPMIYFNDVLYAASPALLDLDPTKLEQIGEIESVTASSEIPQINGQANDEIMEAPIYASGDNIIVLIRGSYYLYEPR